MNNSWPIQRRSSSLSAIMESHQTASHWIATPLEKLFERFVAAALRNALASSAKMVTQASNRSLCLHNQEPTFRLQPDLLVESGTQRWMLDTKWKRLNESDPANHYGLSQTDFYQLFAYGQKYLSGQGEMVMIYLRNEAFTQALPVFDFGNNLRLWALPFDLETECLVDGGQTTLPMRGNGLNAAAFEMAAGGCLG